MDKPPIVIVTDVVPVPTTTGANTRLRDLILHLRHRGLPVHVLLQRDCVEWQSLDFFQHFAASLTVTPKIKDKKNEPQVVGNWFGRRLHTFLVWHLSRFAWGNGLLNFIRLICRRPAVPFQPIADFPRKCSTETRQALIHLESALQPAVIFVIYAWMVDCLSGLDTKAKLVLDSIDVMHQRSERLANHKHLVEWSIGREQEIEILSKFDTIIAIQEDEAEVFRAMVPEKRVITVGTSYPLRAAAPSPIAGRLLFIGGPNAGNVLGMTRFLKEVWPLVLKARPETELEVCGKIGEELKGRARRVLMKGFIEDADQAYDEAAVIINPLWVGSGLKIKTVEALCRGKALVTTPCGIEGMAPSPEGACRVVEHPEEMAAAIIELLGEPEKRKALEAKAYEYARQWLSPTQVYRELDELLNA